MTQSSGRTVYDEVVDLVVRHGKVLLTEDLIFHGLRDYIKNYCKEHVTEYCASKFRRDECIEKCEDRVYDYVMKNFIYAERNEPVRIGVFRALFHEIYSKIHGNLAENLDHIENHIELVVHGIMKERKDQYEVGIDYVSLISYPSNKHPESRVVVPLFIIAKSSKNRIRKVELDKALEEAQLKLKKIMQELQKEGKKDDIEKHSENIEKALNNMKRFTRIVITGIDMGWALQKSESYRCEDTVKDLVVYNDMVCGLIHLVFKYIPEAYKTVTEDQDLAKLTIENWLLALLLLNMPIAGIAIPSADSLPSDLGGISVHDLVGRIYEGIAGDVVGRLDQIAERIHSVGDKLMKPKLKKLLKQLREEVREENRMLISVS